MIKTYLNHLVATAEKNYLTNIFQELSKVRAEKILDIGCYTGKNTIQVARSVQAKEVYGIEFDQKAREEASKKGIKLLAQNIDEKKWLLDDNSFDFVFSNQVIEHLYSVDNFVINIKRILRRDGHALISTENLSAWHNVFALFLGYQPFSSTNICTKNWSIGNPFSIVLNGHNNPLIVHRAVFTYYALRKFLELYDFKIIKSITSGYYPLPNNKVGNFFAKIDKKHSVIIAFLVSNNK